MTKEIQVGRAKGQKYTFSATKITGKEWSGKSERFMKTNYAKWILDFIYFIRGEEVWKAYDNLEKNQWLDESAIKSMQFEKLMETISFAYHNIPFYRTCGRRTG